MFTQQVILSKVLEKINLREEKFESTLFVTPPQMISNSAFQSSEDIQYWISQTKEQILIGFNNSKQIFPFWMILHPNLKEQNTDLQSICIFDEISSDVEIYSTIKSLVKDLQAHAVFHVSPGLKEDKDVLLFISETQNFRQEEIFHIKISNQEFYLTDKILSQENLNIPPFFERSNEDLC